MKFKSYIFLNIVTLLLMSRIAFTSEPAPFDKHKERIHDIHLSKIVSNMQPGEWKEIPGTAIPLITYKEAEAIKETPDEMGIWGWTGSTSVIIAWNSAAYDPEGMKWYFFGGGHADYGGNEVYEFDVSKLKWSRLTKPSPLRGVNISIEPEKRHCPAPLYGPSSTHTYDGLTWNPVSKSFWSFGHLGFCTDGYAFQQGYWEFKPSDLSWKQHLIESYSGGLAMSTWNPVTRKITVIPRGYLHKGAVGPFEVDENGKRSRIGKFYYGSNEGIMEYYPDGGYAIVVSGPNMYKQRLDSDPLPELELFLKIPKAVIDIDLRSSGMKYDPTINKFVIWNGDSSTWLFDPKTKVFASLVNDKGPTGRTRRVYDKFIYVDKYDVFLGYNDPAGNVWVYKRSLQATPLDDK